jgi:hypothetical protein
MLMRISNRSVIATVKHQVSCDLAGEVVILNMKDGFYYGLNGVGARIWSLLEEPRRVADIQETLLDEYEVDPQVCETHLMALLKDLAAHGLVEIKE